MNKRRGEQGIEEWINVLRPTQVEAVEGVSGPEIGSLIRPLPPTQRVLTLSWQKGRMKIRQRIRNPKHYEYCAERCEREDRSRTVFINLGSLGESCVQTVHHETDCDMKRQQLPRHGRTPLHLMPQAGRI
jgi:hypothetical protein